MADFLLSTRLYIPPAPPGAVPRPRLVEKLLHGLRAPGSFALLSGPAGFGKTTLLGDFVSRLEPPAAWLSLDDGDNDPARFWACLAAACRSAGAPLGDLAPAAPLPAAGALPVALVNELAGLVQRRGRDLVLVLDDYHVIQNESIHSALAFLLEHAPPQLHLVVSTRADPPWPLARWRARGRLVEVRAGDLRFSLDEAAAFLNRRMGLSLSPAEVAALEARTEGWAAGLQLAALSLQGRSDPAGFIRAFSGSHVYVAEYLLEEVLQGQPPELHAFLLQTSILERLEAGLCAAVTGRPDARSMLAALRRANCFIFPLDDEGRWFRYHALFAGLLQARLQRDWQPDSIAGLHARAGRWFEAAGLPGEAIRHALAAADYPTALRLVEAHALEMLVRGYAATLEGWLDALPARLGRPSPRIHMAFIWMHLLHSDFAAIPPYVERLQAAFAGPQAGEPGPAAASEWLTLQSFLAGAQGSASQALALARQALETSPSEDSYVQSMAYNALAAACELAGDYPAALHACRQAIRHGRATHNVFAELMGCAILVQIALQHGQSGLAFETAAEGIRRAEGLGLQAPVSAILYAALGQVHSQRGQLEPARANILRGLRLASLGSHTDVEIYLRVVYSRLLQLEGDLQAAAREIQSAGELIRDAGTGWARDEVLSQQVRLSLAQGQPAAAEAALRARGVSFPPGPALPAPGPGQASLYTQGLLAAGALRLLACRAEAGLDLSGLRSGIDLAGSLIAAARQEGYLLAGLEALLLRARLHAALGETAACLDDLALALELAQPQGFITPFVEEGPVIQTALRALLRENRLGPVPPDYLRAILAAFSAASSRAAPASAASSRAASSSAASSRADSGGLVEPLTTRELEVLRLIGEGCSNQQIAARLVLSLHTVKKHVSHLFAKLGANSRTQALARAGELKLL